MIPPFVFNGITTNVGEVDMDMGLVGVGRLQRIQGGVGPLGYTDTLLWEGQGLLDPSP